MKNQKNVVINISSINIKRVILVCSTTYILFPLNMNIFSRNLVTLFYLYYILLFFVSQHFPMLDFSNVWLSFSVDSLQKGPWNGFSRCSSHRGRSIMREHCIYQSIVALEVNVREQRPCWADKLKNRNDDSKVENFRRLTLLS